MPSDEINSLFPIHAVRLMVEECKNNLSVVFLKMDQEKEKNNN